MKSSLSSGIIKSNKILENSLLQMTLYQYPKKKNELINPLNSCDSYKPIKMNLSSNNSTSSNDNSSAKVKINSSFNSINQYFNRDNKAVYEQKTGNLFLGKKTKIFFNVNKNDKKKQFFITSKIKENSESNINNISQDNKAILNIVNSNNPENTFSDKSAGQIIQLEKTLPIKEKPKLFHTINYNLFETSKEERKKEGKWSYDENIKFIKAYVNFGKNYKLSQKYIGTRNPMQIRSHAQKFFIKLKKLKNNDFDFSDENIKNLSDIFKLIEEQNKSNIDNKEYIINTLISLCRSIRKNENNYLNKKTREKYEKLPKNKNDNEDKMFIFKNNAFINSNLNLKKDEMNKNGIVPEEIDINKNINIEQNQKKPKNDNFVNEKKNCNYGNVDNYLNPNFKLDDDYIYSEDDSDFFGLDGISSDVYNFSFVKNNKPPSFNFNS